MTNPWASYDSWRTKEPPDSPRCEKCAFYFAGECSNQNNIEVEGDDDCCDEFEWPEVCDE